MKKRDQLIRIYNILYSFYGPQKWWPGDSPFEIAIGAILTQNTNWGNVEKAINNLKREGVMSVEGLNRLSDEKIASLIKPAGYFNIKTKRIRAFLDFLIDKYNGKIEEMKKEDTISLRNKLLNIYGIGAETADSILLYALEKPVFVIDAYTKRVLTRHSIMKPNSTYSDYQMIFHKELDEDLQMFNEFHALFVRVGKDYCKVKPLCKNCPLADLL